MMHAENGIAIDVLVSQALSRGETAPRFHGLTRPDRLEAEATSRAIALAKVTGAPALHRPPLHHRRPRGRRPGPQRGPERLRRDLPAVPVPFGRRPRPRGLRGGEVRLLPAAAGPGAPGQPMAGPAHRRPVGRLHRPLPVLLQGAKGARGRGLLQDPQRPPRRRAPHRPHLPGGAGGRDHPGRAGSRSTPRRRPGCSASTREKGCSRRGPTPTSCSTTRRPRRPSRRPRTT